MDKEFAEAFKEEIELDEKWEVGVVYHQDFGGGEISYFRADSVLKNKRWKGMSVDEFGGKQRRPNNITADEKVQGWKTTPKNEIPKALKEEVEIEEKKSATGYELYHKTFSDAMQHAYAHAKSKGFVVDPKEIDDKVATGPKKPSSGKTNRYSLKAGRKKVEIQVANLDNKRYELNMYIEGVELDELYKDYPGKGHLMPEDRPKIKPKDIIWRSKVHHWDQDVRSPNTRLVIVKNKGKFSMYAKSDKSGEIVFHFGDKPTLDDAKEFASIRKWQEKK